MFELYIYIILPVSLEVYIRRPFTNKGFCKEVYKMYYYNPVLM